MFRSHVIARHLKMARAALNLSVKDFARFVGVSPNTISNVENARNTQSDTTDAIIYVLQHTKGLIWIPDNGKSVGIRLDYKNVPLSFEDAAVKLHEFKKGRLLRSDDHAFERGKLASNFPIEKYLRQNEKRQKKMGRDKRVKQRPRSPGRAAV